MLKPRPFQFNDKDELANFLLIAKDWLLVSHRCEPNAKEQTIQTFSRKPFTIKKNKKQKAMYKQVKGGFSVLTPFYCNRQQIDVVQKNL